MGIAISELVQRYPVLYHMASWGSWPMIQKYGLLSSSKLIDLFEVPEPRRTQLLSTQRKKSELLSHPVHGTAALRDQKPLSAKNLARCLRDCDPASWYRILNERVFFWLDRERLITLMSAKEYVGKDHTILQIDSSDIVERYADQIELAHMNTGNTRPFPHSRGRDTFRSMKDYDYKRRRKLADYSAVVELTVMGSVANFHKSVKKVEHASISKGIYTTKEVLFQR
jgi:hypothetical protein